MRPSSWLASRFEVLIPPHLPGKTMEQPTEDLGSSEDDWAPASSSVSDLQREFWLINGKDVHVDSQKLLGKGGFGHVLQGTLRGTPVAVKEFSCSLAEITEEEVRRLITDLRMLYHVRHPNLVMLYGAIVDQQMGRMSMVLEFISDQRLDSWLVNDHRGLPVIMDRYEVLLSISAALRHLHERSPPIVHGHLCGSNIAVKRTAFTVQARLLDFGLWQLLPRRPRCTDKHCPAPELLTDRGSAARPPVDVFAFGCLLHFVATGTRPLLGLSRRTLLSAIKSHRFPSMEWPQDCILSKYAKSLASGCLSVEPQDRLSIEDVCNGLVHWRSPLRRTSRLLSGSIGESGGVAKEVNESCTNKLVGDQEPSWRSTYSGPLHTCHL